MFYLKPTKLKIIISLAPIFIFLALLFVDKLDQAEIFSNSDLFNALGIVLIAAILFLSAPFWPVLEKLGMIKGDFIKGPTESGMAIIVVIYFVIIYFITSLIQYLINRKKRNEV